MGLQEAANTMVAGGALLPTVASLLGGSTNNHAGRDQRQATSYAIQASVLDKVAAAKQAGISPLYALGAPVMSATSAVGSPSAGGNQLAESLTSMGQNVSRALAGQQTEAERQLQALSLQNMGLQNDLLKAQIASSNNRTVREAAPALPLTEPMAKSLPGPGDITANAAQNEFGDIIENLYGAGRFAEYADREINRWSLSNLGFDLNSLTPSSLGTALGKLLWSDMKGPAVHDAVKARTYYYGR